jgi:hypothetical protein
MSTGQPSLHAQCHNGNVPWEICCVSQHSPITLVTLYAVAPDIQASLGGIFL